VSLDQGYMRGEIRAEASQGCRLHQITSPNGAVVKEYISPEGKVFGISRWRRSCPTCSSCWNPALPTSGKPYDPRRRGAAGRWWSGRTISSSSLAVACGFPWTRPDIWSSARQPFRGGGIPRGLRHGLRLENR